MIVPAINKNIVVYKYGKGEKKKYYWSMVGQEEEPVVQIAVDELVKVGFTTISFDAPMENLQVTALW
jgi:hypothetical protein